MGNSNSRSKAPFEWGAVGGSFSQQKTNGKSVLGTLVAPMLPLFLLDNPTPNGYPWSTLNARTNYYQECPNTGVIRQYDFTVSRGRIAPDGYEVDVMLVNGAFPGPTIEANWGDTIQVTVHNEIDAPAEGVALHWHGFLQKGMPWEDGVPAVTQCPIPPGKSYTYQFQAELYGTTWYHSHYSAQYGGGLFGPMVIYGPRDCDYDVDLGPIIINDWYHKEYYDLVEQTMAPNATPVFSDNNLINGKMNFNCSSVPKEDKTPCNSNAGISKFKFQRGKKHRLRLINAGAEALQRFTIDGHTMTVIANDFVQVEPYETKVVTLGIGQRTDVIVEANGDLDAYWMRANISIPCSLARQPNATAAIYYDDAADDTAAPKSRPWDIPDPGTCVNDDLSLTRPVMNLPVPERDLDLELKIESFKNASGVTLWKFGGVNFRGNYNSPTMLLANLGNHSFEEEWNVRSTGNAKSVRVTVINGSPIPHPIHLHGFNMYILHEGLGAWDGTIVNPENPQRRDVFQIRGNGHVVVQFDAADNPGMWPFHCHIAWHVSAGFFVQFLTNPDAVEKFRIPNVVAETCRQWGTWTDTNIPAQIDSGL